MQPATGAGQRPLLQICLGYLDCPGLAKDAATYLILSQNRLQDSFEFGIVDLDELADSVGIQKLDARGEQDGDEYEKRVRAAVEGATAYVSSTFQGDLAPIPKDV